MSTKLIECCSDGVEDQGAEEALMGPRENRFVSFGSRLLCERPSFQRVKLRLQQLVTRHMAGLLVHVLSSATWGPCLTRARGVNMNSLVTWKKPELIYSVRLRP